MKTVKYVPHLYWEKRLVKDFTLGGTGHIGLGERFNRWVYKSKAATVDRVVKALNIDLRGKKVLDVGCGTGFWVDYWIGRGAGAVTGIDIAETSIRELSRRYPFHTFVVSDLQKEWRIEEKYEIISAFAVLQHIVDEEGFNTAIANIGGSLAQDGYLFISDGFTKNASSPEWHVYWRTFERYRTALLAQNIEVISVFPMAVLMDIVCDMEFTKHAWVAWFINSMWHKVTKPAVKSKWLGPLKRGIGPSLFCIDRILLRLIKDGPSTKLLVARYRCFHDSDSGLISKSKVTTKDGQLERLRM